MNRRTRDRLRKDFANLATGNAEVTIGGQTLNKMLKQLSYFAVLGFLFLTYASAQTTNGLITGAVTDPTGAFVPGAQISVTNQNTSLSRATATNNSGSYILPQLPPGLYKINVSKGGFSSVSRDNVELR